MDLKIYGNDVCQTLALVHDANMLQSNPRTQLLLIVVSLLPSDYVLIYGRISLRLLLTIQIHSGRT